MVFFDSSPESVTFPAQNEYLDSVSSQFDFLERFGKLGNLVTFNFHGQFSIPVPTVGMADTVLLYM